MFLFGRPGRIVFRIRARSRTVTVRLYVRSERTQRLVASIPLGRRRAGVTQSYMLSGREQGVLPQGRFVLRISARDSRGRGLRSSVRASRSAALGFFWHRMPLAGAFSYGGPGSGFGAGRPGHTHQGQDMSAAEGTPIVAPRGGRIKAVGYQAGGAGNYVVLDGAGENRDYVFMHMRTGSTRVKVGQRVRTGQRIGDVGSTGVSTGPHLHFEVWVGGGWYSGGHPIDPLPLLRAWDRWS